MPPTSDEQIQFLVKLQRLLDEGLFVASYKFALLLALADLSIEAGDDYGGALTITTDQIAANLETCEPNLTGDRHISSYPFHWRDRNKVLYRKRSRVALIRRSWQSLLSTGLRLTGSRCCFSARMMSIVPSHGLCNFLRGERAVVAGVQYITCCVSFGFRFGFHFGLPAFLVVGQYMNVSALVACRYWQVAFEL